MGKENEEKLKKLERKEKGARLAAGAGFLLGIIGSFFQRDLLTSAVLTAGFIVGYLMIVRGVFGILKAKYLPPPENPKRDPVVNQAMSILFGGLILGLCIFVLIQAFIEI